MPCLDASVNWQDFLPFVGSSGVVGALAYLAYRLHLDSVDAHKQRADDWREQASDWRAAYERATERADERDKQMNHILGAVKQATSTTEPAP